jgi:hypothetical protein
MTQPSANLSGKYPLLPYFVLFAGFVYLCFLAASIQPDVFFQGDGGMKFMVVKQVAGGGDFKNIDLTVPVWVDSIWSQGHFPIKKPFLYPSEEGYTVSFPPGFQIISAQLYKMFGYKGIYIIPIGCLVALWSGMLLLIRRLNSNSVVQAIAMTVLIFCSPATLYGVTYWEHVPAIFLLFCGLFYLLENRVGTFAAVLLGFCSGLAVWLRPEAMVLNALYLGAGFVLWRKEQRTSFIAFALGVILGIGLFFLFNKYYYHSFLGVHGLQVLEEYTLKGRLIRWGKNLLMINWLLIKFFPAILLLIPVLFFTWKKRLALSLPVRLLLIVIVAFCILAPAMLPNTGGGQWGPRYFLPLIPIAIAVLTAAAVTGITKPFQQIAFGFLCIAGLYSAYLNSYKGGVKELRYGYYNRITPALNFVKTSPEQVVVVSSEHIPMELGAVFKEKFFFLAEDENALAGLREKLKQNDVERYIYINEFNTPPAYPNILTGDSSTLKRIGTYYLGKYDLKK